MGLFAAPLQLTPSTAAARCKDVAAFRLGWVPHIGTGEAECFSCLLQGACAAPGLTKARMPAALLEAVPTCYSDISTRGEFGQLADERPLSGLQKSTSGSSVGLP